MVETLQKRIIDIMIGSGKTKVAEKLVAAVIEMDEHKYKDFVSFVVAGLTLQDAYCYVNYREYVVYEDCSDMIELSKRLAPMRCPEAEPFVWEIFDYEAYVDVLLNQGTWFLDKINKRVIQVFELEE